MSQTIFRHGPFRFYFFSREEERMHVLVQASDGEAKFWLEPRVELANNYGLIDRQLKTTLQLVQDHESEIRKAWKKHFGG